MAIRVIARTKGYVHDIDKIKALSDGCNLVVLSDRALYVLQNLAEADCQFPSRYGHILDDGLYIPIELDGSEDEQAYQQTIYEISGGLSMGCLEDFQAALVAAIQAAGQTAGLCCDVRTEVTGQYSEPDSTTGNPGSEVPPGYGTTPNTPDDHCLMSNYYYRQFIATLELFDTYNVLGWLAVGLSAGISQIIALLTEVLATAFVPLVTGQFGAMIAIAEELLDLPDTLLTAMITALEADEEGFVCAMYTAGNVGQAQNNLGDWAQSNFTNIAQIGLMNAILNPYALAGLFFPSDAALAEAAELVDPFDCAACYPEGTVFKTSEFDPYNVIVLGVTDPQWTGNPDDDITESASGGWCSQTVRGLGSYRQIFFYFPNPNFGGGAPVSYHVRIDFTLRNMALESPSWNCNGNLTKSNITRGPGYSSNAFRASTGGLTDLVSWEECDITVPTTCADLRFGGFFYYDANYNNALPGCMRKITVTLTPN